MSCQAKYDDLLYPILRSEGNVQSFVDKIFEFLYRRTDFFKIKLEGTQSVGLASGEAENVVKCTFCKYMGKSLFEQKRDQENSVSIDFIAEEVVSSVEDDESLCSPSVPSSVSLNDVSLKNARNDSQPEPRVSFVDSDSYNGARYEDYCWSQTLSDIDLRIKVPPEVTTGKQVQVALRKSHLKAEILEGDEWQTLKVGPLSSKIYVQESTWTLVPGDHIHVCLQKNPSKWWESLFVDEAKIDLKKIDPAILFEDLDQESQAKIEELMYSEHLKRQGKPTIKQQKVQDALKEAWNSEGSPFKGQPFDPSVLDVKNIENL